MFWGTNILAVVHLVRQQTVQNVAWHSSLDRGDFASRARRRLIASMSDIFYRDQRWLGIVDSSQQRRWGSSHSLSYKTLSEELWRNILSQKDSRLAPSSETSTANIGIP